MKELESAIVAAFGKMAESGAIQTIIEKKIEATVESILGDVLKSYSDFGKELSNTVKEALKVDMSDLGLTGYNDIVLKIIKAKLDSQIMIAGKDQIEKDLEELLKPAPTEIKLSDLVEQMKKSQWGNDNSECTCIVRWSDNSDGYCWIYLDQDGGKERYFTRHELAVTKDGEVYSFSIDKRNPANQIFCGPFYNFERSLFQMYTAKTKLIIDEDDVNIYYPGYED